MSSLLQFSGEVSKRGVNLQFVHINKQTILDFKTLDKDGIFYPGGKWLARIWTAWRKPCGMFGCWVVFRYNGEKHVPDLSIPISVERLPKDCVPLTNEENWKVWKS